MSALRPTGLSAHRSVAAVAAVVVFAVLVAAVELWRLFDTEREVDATELAIAALARDVDTVSILSKEAPSVEWGERPTADLIAEVSDVLAKEGISGSALESLSPAERRTEGGSRDAPDVSVQGVRLALVGLDEDALGRFLARWRETHPLWTAAAIDIGFLGGGSSGDRIAGRDQKMRVTLEFEAKYHAALRP